MFNSKNYFDKKYSLKTLESMVSELNLRFFVLINL